MVAFCLQLRPALCLIASERLQGQLGLQHN